VSFKDKNMSQVGTLTSIMETMTTTPLVLD